MSELKIDIPPLLARWWEWCEAHPVACETVAKKPSIVIEMLWDEVSSLRAQLATLSPARTTGGDDLPLACPVHGDKCLSTLDPVGGYLDAVRELTALRSALRALRDKWRTELETMANETDEESIKRYGTIMDPDGYCMDEGRLKDCADALDTLLASEEGQK